MTFPYAQGVYLQNCFFQEINGEYLTNDRRRRLDGLEILCEAASADTAYNSEKRYPPPRCMDGTRIHVLDTIRNWLWAAEVQPILWLHGPFGTGKSAIAQTVCETCAAHDELLASFFYSADVAAHNTIANFVPTLAYQIATSLPRKHRALITKAIEEEPSIWSEDMGTQMEKLILRPLSDLPPVPQMGRGRFAIIIDGIDQLESITQLRLLNLILTLTRAKLLRERGVRIIITSRPEPHIFQQFERGNLKKYSIILPIQTDKDDVRTFLQREFSKMYDSDIHASVLKYVPQPWPSDEDLQRLVDQSEGLFAYASTIIRHVAEEGYICVDRLRELINPKNRSVHSIPFKAIDSLYLRILSSCNERKLVVRIFAFLILVKQKIPRSLLQLTSISRVIEILFDLRPGEMKIRLRTLHSILHITEHESGEAQDDVQFRHGSFQDFLLDPQRSGPWYVDREAMETYFFSASLRHMMEWNDASIYHADERSTFAWGRVIEIWTLMEVSDATFSATLGQHIYSDTHSTLLDNSESWSKDVKCHYLQQLDRIAIRTRNLTWVGHTNLYESVLDLSKNTYKSFFLGSGGQDNLTYLQHLRAMQEVGCVRNMAAIRDMLIILGCKEPPASGISIYFDRRINKSTSLQLFLNDAESWGTICTPSYRHSVLANACLSLLEPETFDDTGKLVFCYASQMWALHLSSTPIGDYDLIVALQKVNVYPAFAFDHDWSSLGWREPAKNKAERVARWLKKSFNAPQELIARWDIYSSDAFWPITTA